MKIDIAEIQQEFDRLNQCYYDRLEEDEDQMFRLVEELGENFDELYDSLISASNTCEMTLLGNNYCILIYEANIDSFDGDLPQIEDLHIEPDFKKLDLIAYYNMEKISNSQCLYDEEYFFRSDAEALGKIVAYLLSGENQLFLIVEYGEQPKLPDLCAKNS